MRPTQTEPIAIVGAGAAGLACAWVLSREGFAVTVVDEGLPTQNALWASGGMLAAGFECAFELDAKHALRAEFAALAARALELWPDWVARLEAEASMAVDFERCGSVTPILSAEESARAAQAATRARDLGFNPERWTEADLTAAEPSLAGHLGGLHFPDDAQLDNRKLAAALIAACQSQGVQFEVGRKATGLDFRAGQARGVILEGESIVSAAQIILATGASTLTGAVTPPAMTSVKGQMVAFAAARPLAPNRIVRSLSIYLAAKSGNRLIAGATSEVGCHDTNTDEAALKALTQAARALVPGLVAVPVTEQWAGLRPRSSDAMPILGELASGVIFAGGGYRNGVLLAPMIAEAVRSALVTGDWPEIARPFGPNRASLASV